MYRVGFIAMSVCSPLCSPEDGTVDGTMAVAKPGMPSGGNKRFRGDSVTCTRAPVRRSEGPDSEVSESRSGWGRKS